MRIGPRFISQKRIFFINVNCITRIILFSNKLPVNGVRLGVKEVVFKISQLKQQQNKINRAFTLAAVVTLAIWSGQTALASGVINILTQPVGQVVSPSQSVTFNVKAEGAALTYQWYHQMHPIPGATSTSYTVDNAQENKAGRYMVVVKDGQGRQVVSSTATLSVLDDEGIAITKQPANLIVDEGDDIELSVEAKGKDLHYQWYSYGLKLNGAEYPKLRLSNVGAKADGLYYCMISSASERVYSSVVEVTVNASKSDDAAFQSAIADQAPQPAYLDSFSQYSSDQFDAYNVSGPGTDGPSSAEKVNIVWERPEKREDGSLLPVTDISAYHLYRASEPGGEKVKFMTLSPDALEVTLESLSVGTHYFTLATVDSVGTESQVLSEFSVTLN